MGGKPPAGATRACSPGVHPAVARRRTRPTIRHHETPMAPGRDDRRPSCDDFVRLLRPRRWRSLLRPCGHGHPDRGHRQRDATSAPPRRLRPRTAAGVRMAAWVLDAEQWGLGVGGGGLARTAAGLRVGPRSLGGDAGSSMAADTRPLGGSWRRDGGSSPAAPASPAPSPARACSTERGPGVHPCPSAGHLRA